MKKTSTSGLSRRQFLKNASAAGALLSFPTIVPSSVFGQNAPSNRITLGCIGVGGHGTQVNMNSFLNQKDAQILSVCDVHKYRMQEAKKKVDEGYGNTDCQTVADFRDVINDPAIDAVVISTPDHWHVPMAIMASEAGKDVFCEKPTKAIQEGRELINVIRKNNTVFQMGLEDRSVIHYHKMVEWLRNGAIGDLERVEITLPHDLRAHPLTTNLPVPEHLDYNLFVGPAPWLEYQDGVTNMAVWRTISNFGCGTLLDWGSHQFDTAQLAVNAPEVCPIEVQGTGDIPQGMVSDVPITFDVDFLYSNGVTVNVKTGGTGIKLFGSKGWVGNESWRGGLKASDDSILRTKYSPEESKHWQKPASEHRNFLDCIKSREATTYTEDTMHLLHQSLHMGDIAIRLGRKVKWNQAKEAFINDDEANAMRAAPPARDWAAEV